MCARLVLTFLLALSLPGEKPAPMTKAPQRVSSPAPEYTDEARAQRIEGSVLLRGVIGTEGRVTNISVARGLGYGLNDKAVDCLRKWIFKPAVRDGEPVAVKANVEINFRLF
jgi:TonB family protein